MNAVPKGLTKRFPHEKIGYKVEEGKLVPLDERAEAAFSSIMEEAALRNADRSIARARAKTKGP
jgi:hypothetical protein